MTAVTQLDLFAIQGGCGYPGCAAPATHGARCSWVRGGHEQPVTTGVASRDCCLPHANYFASAWTPMYPASRDVAWIDILEAS